MTPNISRRRLLSAATLAGFGPLAAYRSEAQQRGLTKIFVGFPAGGTADSLARVIASLMAQPGQSMIVENKPGASGQLAADAVRSSSSDGATLLLTPSSILSLVPHLYRKPMYDSTRDFTPIGCVCDHSFGFAVSGSSPHRSFQDFVQWVKKNPKEASFATPGLGTAPHFLGTVLGRELGVPLMHVPYKGVAPGLQDLMAGQVVSTFNPLPTMLEFHKAGRIRILAVTNPTRVTSLPDVPTFTELKLSAIELVEWYGLFTSPKASAAVIASLNARLTQAVATPDMSTAAKRLEVALRPADGKSLSRMLEADSKRWQDLVKATGISLDT